MLPIIILLLLIFEIINALKVNSKNDFINNINKEEVFDVDKYILIDYPKDITIQSKTITLNGYKSGGNYPVLQFSNNVIFQKNCVNIEMNDIVIYGNFKFHNNQNIKFKNVSYNGYFIAENDNENLKAVLQISGSAFALQKSNIGNEIKGYDVTINQSGFTGNNVYNTYILKFSGMSSSHPNELKVSFSSFNGNYHNSAVISTYSNNTISSVLFEKCYSGKILDSGGALTLEYANNEIKKSVFQNNFSENNGGSIYFRYTYNTEIYDIKFLNTTSSETGGAFSIFSDGTYSTNTTIKTILHTGFKKKNIFTTEGTFISVFGENWLTITNYGGSYINTGTVLYFSGDPKVVFKDFKLDNVYLREGNSIIKTANKKKDGPNLNFNNFHVKNVEQYSMTYSAALFYLSGGLIKFSDASFNNIVGIRSGLSYQDDLAEIMMEKIEFSNFHSRHPEPLFYVNHEKVAELAVLYGDDVTISNIYEDGVLFYINNANVEFRNSKFDNIHECFLHNDCASFEEELSDKFESAIAHIMKDGIINDDSTYSAFRLRNSNLNHIYGRQGYDMRIGNTIVSHCIIQNSYFQRGFIYYSRRYNIANNQSDLEYIEFYNNTSESGTFLYIDDQDETISRADLAINDCTFKNNRAEKFGGIVYSNARNGFSTGINFIDCKFDNNKALLGNLFYSFDKKHEPYLAFRKTLMVDYRKKDKYNIVSNPTVIKFDNYDNKLIKIYSGERITTEYSCSLYDDYGNKFELDKNIENISLKDLVLYEISLKGSEDDSLLSKIYGSYKGFCLNNQCKFKDLRLVGYPGKYFLQLKITSFGLFHPFKNNIISMDVEIKTCNRTYINQDRDGINIKSCYLPTCDPPCIHGSCGNDNYCECDKLYTGYSCSDRVQQTRSIIIDIVAISSSYIFIIITLVSSVYLYRYRLHNIVKAASYNFLVVILVGLLFNYTYVLISTKKEYTDIECLFILWIKNAGFTLIFGGIVTKSYRIYYISRVIKTIDTKFNIISKYVFIVSLLAFHTIFAVIHLIAKTTKYKKFIDSEGREYSKCDYSKLSILSSMMNLIFVIVGIYLAYQIRRINSKFKEPLSILFYSYFFYMIVLFSLENVKYNKLEYSFDLYGTLIYSYIVLHFLYFKKFFNIYYMKKNNLRGSSSSFLSDKNLFNNFNSLKASQQFNSLSRHRSESVGVVGVHTPRNLSISNSNNKLI